MASRIDQNQISAADVSTALNELYFDIGYGNNPVIDQYEALETYLAFEGGDLAAVPTALDAYLEHQQRSTT